LAAGCATGPERAADAATEPQAALAADAQGAASAVGAAAIGTTPPLVVDAREAAAIAPPIRCREMLRKGSNVIVRYCGTEAQWKSFDLRQQQDAQQMVRELQGGRYR
jgi:hypothetical protein